MTKSPEVAIAKHGDTLQKTDLNLNTLNRGGFNWKCNVWYFGVVVWYGSITYSNVSKWCKVASTKKL